MRFVSVAALLVASATFAWTQPPPKAIDKTPKPRFGIAYKEKAYPQDTPKKALASAIEAIDRGETSYLLAHLLDPGFVDFSLGERAKQFEAPVELELTRLRDFQLANRDRFEPEDRVPTDKEQFKALILERSRERAFRQLIRDVEAKLLNDPLSLKDLRKILRAGQFADEAGGARGTHPDVKDRAVYLKKIGDRWFLENRQEEIPKKEPGM